MLLHKTSSRAWARLRALTIVVGYAVLHAPVFAGDRFEEAPINYSAAQPDNPVAKLRDAIRSNPALLRHDAQFGYLKSVLELLEVPVSSQVLVFSKTSLQQRQISPTTPRAIYFNDDVYVGSVPDGDVVEISVADPALGAVFYSLTQDKNDRAEVVRQVDNCLQCHGSTLTGGYPGHMVRSVYTDVSGYPILSAGSFITTQNSPFAERWGGWYVTGTHGGARHMGNGIAEAAEYEPTLDREAGANQLTLHKRVNPANYLAAQSDIVALMVLGHQTHMHNLMTQASFDTRFALRDQAVLDELLKETGGALSDSTKRRIESAANKLVDYMLFVHEPRLEAPVTGSTDFAAQFAARGPRDSQGRSLRDFDLQTRLFKYPLSYLIYSPQFDGLPSEARDFIYARLWKILSDDAREVKPAHLDAATRQALREILRETKQGLPSFWQ